MAKQGKATTSEGVFENNKYKPYLREFPNQGNAVGSPTACFNSLSASSPQRIINDEDLRAFENGANAFYDITTGYTENDKLRQERKRLLSELCVPLNNCASKVVSVGMDPFRNFETVVKILKSGVNAGVSFTFEEFREFMGYLPEIMESLESGTLVFEKPRYKLCYVSPETCKIISQGNTFELYVMHSTLRNLLEMKDFLMLKVNSINKCTDNFKALFNKFRKEVIDNVIKSENLCLDNSVVINTLKSNYADQLVLYELVFKFNLFVVSDIQKELDLDQRMKLY